MTARTATNCGSPTAQRRGTSLLKDVNPGSASSNPKYLTVRGNHVLFFANYSGRTSQLWTTDGTTAGTSFVANVTSAGAMTALGNEVLFEGNDGIHGTELWVSDGTAAGTGELADLNPGSTGSYPGSFTVTGNTALFSALYGSQFDLWSTDGTAAGTAIVSTAPSSPSTFFAAPALGLLRPPCTLIMTPDGLIPVEQIAVGGMVTIFGGRPGRTRQMGRPQHPSTRRRHPRPWDVHPRPHPRRRLRKDHAATRPEAVARTPPCSPDGVLIPIRHLVNDTTIVQEEGGGDHLLARRARHPRRHLRRGPCRWRLIATRAAATRSTTRPVRALYAGFAARTTAGSFAPMIETGTRDRPGSGQAGGAGAPPPGRRTRDPAACGSAPPAQCRRRSPAGIGRIHLVSPSRHPDGDQRRLGAAVCGVTLDGQALPLDGGCMTAAVPRHGDGRGQLALDGWAAA